MAARCAVARRRAACGGKRAIVPPWTQALVDRAVDDRGRTIADDPLVSIAHTLVSSPGVMALLVGSGVSRSADIPTGWDVTLKLIRELAAVRGQPPPSSPADWFETTFDAPPDYSAVLEHLARSPEGRRNVLEQSF